MIIYYYQNIINSKKTMKHKMKKMRKISQNKKEQKKNI